MKNSYYFVIFFVSLLGVATAVTYSVFGGKTGNGKSYISTLIGCPSKVGSGTSSTTKDVVICKDKYKIDMVGLDDDGTDYKANYNGQEISLSGLSYPVYNLFEALEREKIDDVEFFLVFDANNMKLGGSSAFFMEFVQNDLQCPITRVLNKYRDEHPDHRANYKPGDQIVREFATSADLKGTSCRFALAPDWRKKVIDQDLAAVRSMIKPENCDKLLARKKEYEAIRDKVPQSMSTKDCTYNRATGTVNLGGGWSLNVGIASFGKSDKIQTIYEKAVDEDCARLRSENNAALEAANQRLHEEKLSWISQLATIDEGLAECRLLPNWKENRGEL